VALAVTPMLLLPVALDLRGMGLAVMALVIGMRLPPLTSAVAHYLCVLGIGFEPVTMILGAPLTLTLRLATNALIGTELGWLEELLAIAAATSRRQAGLL